LEIGRTRLLSTIPGGSQWRANIHLNLKRYNLLYAAMRSPKSLAWLAEEITQILFGFFQPLALSRRKPGSRPVDIEIQHRHCGAERVGLAATTEFSGSLKGLGDSSRVVEREHVGFQIERVAALGCMS
jgi:hypothetical protein